MNKKQKTTLWISIIIVALMVIFPPNRYYRTSVTWVDLNGNRIGYGGDEFPYGFLFTSRYIYHEVLLVQCAIVAIIGVGLIYIFRIKKPKEKQKE